MDIINSVIANLLTRLLVYKGKREWMKNNKNNIDLFFAYFFKFMFFPFFRLLFPVSCIIIALVDNNHHTLPKFTAVWIMFICGVLFNVVTAKSRKVLTTIN